MVESDMRSIKFKVVTAAAAGATLKANREPAELKRRRRSGCGGGGNLNGTRD